MSSPLVPGPGRTYLYGVYGSLIGLASCIALYLEGEHYLHDLCVTLIGMIWTVARFSKENKASKK
jgi:hypothetical protein